MGMARQRATWNQTGTIAATVLNAQRSSKRDKVWTADDFNPLADRKRRDEKIGDFKPSELKAIFLGGKTT